MSEILKETTSEEGLKLVKSFGDIYLAIGISILLISAAAALKDYSLILTASTITALSWILAEIFVRKKRSALPAILLTLVFIFSFYPLGFALFKSPMKPQNSEVPLLFLFTVFPLTFIASYLHWLRFKIPIAVALMVLTLMLFIFSLLLKISAGFWILAPFIFLLLGFTTLRLAVYFDLKDITRSNINSDIAFWLHLLAAPIIIHPSFALLSKTGFSFLNIICVSILLILISLLSIILNRKVFILSGLSYFIAILTTVTNAAGLPTSTSGIIVGSSLLAFFYFWDFLREKIVYFCPKWVKKFAAPV